ncbi:MAG: alanine dehydrogenase [Alphaproteobacteria bacterium]|jgi:alanine dehydrogenase|nr:alanine dehydrogenase [Alphaproteobacteria bacterium]QQS56254.1 MAG: alanine dehydrogenase [Alphaproteobacteria bacterium]
MRIGVPKEIKTLEHRVGLVPSSVKELTSRGHEVLVETGAGKAINFTDGDYEEAGATIAADAKKVFESCDMIVKVKEPQPHECKMLRENQILFTYLHLAADPEQAKGLMDSGCIAIAYETVTGPHGHGLPLLEPMSEIAGRLSVQVGATYLQKHLGGTGRLIGGVPGVKPAEVLIIGGGVSGFHAAQMATGLGANVTILERSNPRMRFLDEHFHGRANIVYSNIDVLERYAKKSDLIIGAVLIPGASAPKLIRKDMLPTMIPGTVFVDIAIDQGGCAETSKPTTHDKPTYIIDNVVHYCVANMPGAVPLTSALALNHSVLPYALRLADEGWKTALKSDANFRNGLNVCHGHITHAAVAQALGLDFTAQPAALAA